MTARQGKILRLILADARVTVDSLAKAVAVSPSTVNRDLRRLKDIGVLSRVGSDIRDPIARVRIDARIDRLRLRGSFGDVRPVGDGVFEMRIDYGPGYRIYYARRGEAVILLLLGGDKSSQRRDIARARKLNEEIR